MDGLIRSQSTDFLPFQESKSKREADKVSSLKDRDFTSMPNKEVRKIAEEFEAFFLSQVFEHMTEGLSAGGFFGGGHSEGIYKSMMNEEYGKAVAARGGYGIGDLIYRDIIKLQSAQLAAKESVAVSGEEREEDKTKVSKHVETSIEAYGFLDDRGRHPSVRPVESFVDKEGDS